MKKRNIIVLITILIGLVIAASTNPNKNDYIEWVTKNEMKKSTNILDRGIISLIGGPIIRNTTVSKNYIILSTYETVLSDKEKIRAIGVFKNFVILSK